MRSYGIFKINYISVWLTRQHILNQGNYSPIWAKTQAIITPLKSTSNNFIAGEKPGWPHCVCVRCLACWYWADYIMLGTWFCCRPSIDSTNYKLTLVYVTCWEETHRSTENTEPWCLCVPLLLWCLYLHNHKLHISVQENSILFFWVWQHTMANTQRKSTVFVVLKGSYYPFFYIFSF